MDKIFSQTGHIKDLDKDKGEMTAYVSTRTRDRSDEVLEPDCVDLKNFRKNPVVLWAHDYTMPPIGKAMWVRKDDVGVLAKFKFASTPLAQEIKTLYEEKVLNAFSVGFVPKESEDGDGEKKPRRTYKKWEMLEFSAVPVPANPDAISLAIQKGLIKTDEVKKALGILEEKPLQEFNDEEKEQELQKVVETSTTASISVGGQTISLYGLEDLTAENKILTEAKEALEKEITTLKYQIYQLIQEKQPPEITVRNFEARAIEIMNGVIRKATGKID